MLIKSNIGYAFPQPVTPFLRDVNVAGYAFPPAAIQMVQWAHEYLCPCWIGEPGDMGRGLGYGGLWKGSGGGSEAWVSRVNVAGYAFPQAGPDPGALASGGVQSRF